MVFNDLIVAFTLSTSRAMVVWMRLTDASRSLTTFCNSEREGPLFPIDIRRFLLSLGDNSWSSSSNTLPSPSRLTPSASPFGGAMDFSGRFRLMLPTVDGPLGAGGFDEDPTGGSVTFFAAGERRYESARKTKIRRERTSVLSSRRPAAISTSLL